MGGYLEEGREGRTRPVHIGRGSEREKYPVRKSQQNARTMARFPVVYTEERNEKTRKKRETIRGLPSATVPKCEMQQRE
jgi:hypothetical protein